MPPSEQLPLHRVYREYFGFVARIVHMDLELFDANLYLGRPMRSEYVPATTAPELLSQLDQRGIQQALVWHVAQHDLSPVTGNAMLAQAIAGVDRLYGAWTILPPQTQEVICDGQDFFGQMKRTHVVALRAFPDFHRYLLTRV